MPLNNEQSSPLTESQPSLAIRALEVTADCAQLLVIGMLLDILLFDNSGVAAIVRFCVIVLLLISVVKSNAWIVVLALQSSLFVREPKESDLIFGVTAFLYCLVAMGIISYANLANRFRRQFSRVFALQFAAAFGSQPLVATNVNVQADRKGELGKPWLQRFAIQLLTLSMVVLFSILALTKLPITSTGRSSWLQNSVENNFTLWPGANMLVCSILLVVIFVESSWRQLTPAQSSLYLRTSFIRYHYRDLRMIVLRRLKNKNIAVKNAAKRKLIERKVEEPSKREPPLVRSRGI